MLVSCLTWSAWKRVCSVWVLLRMQSFGWFCQDPSHPRLSPLLTGSEAPRASSHQLSGNWRNKGLLHKNLATQIKYIYHSHFFFRKKIIPRWYLFQKQNFYESIYKYKYIESGLNFYCMTSTIQYLFLNVLKQLGPYSSGNFQASFKLFITLLFNFTWSHLLHPLFFLFIKLPVKTTATIFS